MIGGVRILTWQTTRRLCRTFSSGHIFSSHNWCVRFLTWQTVIWEISIGQMTIPFFSVPNFFWWFEKHSRPDDCTFFFGSYFFRVVIIGVCILTRAPIMVLTYDRKKLLPEKKLYSHLAGHVFWRVQISTGKNCDLKKKRYSHHADGWNKSQITVCRVKIQTPVITKLEKITTGEKKGTVVWLLVGAQNTKHNTHRHNNQRDEPCHLTLQQLCLGVALIKS